MTKSKAHGTPQPQNGLTYDEIRERLGGTLLRLQWALEGVAGVQDLAGKDEDGLGLAVRNALRLPVFEGFEALDTLRGHLKLPYAPLTEDV